MWTTGVATDYIDLLDRLDFFLTGSGSAFGVSYAGAGDGRLTAYRGGGAAIAQTFTVTALSDTTFSVVGSVTGSHANATVGVAYSNPRVAFTITAGAVPFQAGDAFTFSTAPAWTTLRRSLGAKVLATQGNTGTYAAQNLVDGKTDNGTYNWDLDAPITIPQDVEITLYQEETVTAYELGDFSNFWYPTDWTLDYWDGAAWVTLDTQADFVGITGVVRHFDIAAPVAATRYRLHITAIKYSNGLMLGVLRLLRADGVDAAAGQVIWKAPGNDGDSGIYVGVRPFERADADYYDWELCGFDGFVSTSHLRLSRVPREALPPPLAGHHPLLVRGRRPARDRDRQDQHQLRDGLPGPPRPLLLPRAVALSPGPGRHPRPGEAPGPVQQHALPVERGQRQAPDAHPLGHPDQHPAEPPARGRPAPGTEPGRRLAPVRRVPERQPDLRPPELRALIWPYRGGMRLLDLNLDGSRTLWPVMLNAAEPNTIGQLRGVAAVSGQGLTAETLIRLGAIDWMALPQHHPHRPRGLPRRGPGLDPMPAAYETGISSSPTNLLQSLVSWLAAQGWTLDLSQADASGWRAHLHKSGLYREPPGGHEREDLDQVDRGLGPQPGLRDRLYLGDGHDGGASWVEQPGRPLRTDGPPSTSGCGMNLPAGSVAGYHFFDDGLDNVIVVVRRAPGLRPHGVGAPVGPHGNPGGLPVLLRQQLGLPEHRDHVQPGQRRREPHRLGALRAVAPRARHRLRRRRRRVRAGGRRHVLRPLGRQLQRRRGRRRLHRAVPGRPPEPHRLRQPAPDPASRLQLPGRPRHPDRLRGRPPAPDPPLRPHRSRRAVGPGRLPPERVLVRGGGRGLRPAGDPPGRRARLHALPNFAVRKAA